MKAYSAVSLFAIVVFSVSVMWGTSAWQAALPEGAVCVVAGLWCGLFLSGAERPSFDALMIPLGFVILWGGLQLLTGTTVYRWQTWGSILYWTSNFATFFVCFQVFRDRNIRKTLMQALVVFGFAVAVLSSLQALTSNDRIYWVFPTEYAGWTLMGPFVSHNQFAAFIEILLPVALYNSLEDGQWRVFNGVMAAAMYASVIVSTSRSGFVLATAEVFLIPALAFRHGIIAASRARRGLPAFAGVVLLLGICAGPGNLAARFAIKDPYSIRREYLYSSLQMFRERPLMGVGLGNWATAYPGYALFDDGKYANQAHNDWAQWAVEGGVPLVGAFFWIAGVATIRGVRAVWGMGLAAVFIHCAVDYPIQRIAVSLIFFILLAAVSVPIEPRHANRLPSANAAS